MIKNTKDIKDRTPADVDMDTTSEEEDEGCTIKRLEDISGIGPAAATKLRLLGYTVMGLATARADVVAGEMQVSQTIAKVWCNIAREAAFS